MIGFYDYTVILTFCSLFSSVIGMTLAMQEYFRMAILCLALCGFFDTFDGKVARTKKNRTDDEKMYGIQLDSLVDVISFGVFPIMICYVMGMRTVLDLVILCLYGACGVIRLAFFNVLETNRQMNPTGEEKVFHGLPITSISILMPVLVLLTFSMEEKIFLFILRGFMLLIAFLFVKDFKMKKPTNLQIAILIVVVGIATFAFLTFSKFKLPHHQQQPEEPLIDIELFEEEEA